LTGASDAYKTTFVAPVWASVIARNDDAIRIINANTLRFTLSTNLSMVLQCRARIVEDYPPVPVGLQLAKIVETAVSACGEVEREQLALHYNI
jgi:hypothetical protein